MVEDNLNNVAILARQDSYGEGLSKRLKEVLEEKGATVASYELYSADATNYTAEVNKIAASKPDSLALIGFEETTKIVPQLIAKQVGPQDIPTYFVDGNTADYSNESFDLEGVKATFPAAAEVPVDFNKKLDAIWAPKKLKDYTYGAQSYDAVDADRVGRRGGQGRRRARTVEADHQRLQGRHSLHDVCRLPASCSRTVRTSTTTASPGRSTSTTPAASARPPSASSCTAVTTSTSRSTRSRESSSRPQPIKPDTRQGLNLRKVVEPLVFRVRRAGSTEPARRARAQALASVPR